MKDEQWSTAAAMTPLQLRDALQVSWSTFYKLQSLGRLERFELVPRFGPRRYSRKLVQAYLDGEPSARQLPRMVARR